MHHQSVDYRLSGPARGTSLDAASGVSVPLGAAEDAAENNTRCGGHLVFRTYLFFFVLFVMCASINYVPHHQAECIFSRRFLDAINQL